MKVAADPEQVDGTILDGRDYSSGQLPQENIRIIKEADATLRLNLGTQLDALYDRPHKEITNEGGTLIIIHDADSSEWHFLAYRNFCGALDWFSLSVGGVGVSRGGVEFVPVDAGPVCGRDAVVRFGRRCLFALPQGVGDE